VRGSKSGEEVKNNRQGGRRRHNKGQDKKIGKGLARVLGKASTVASKLVPTRQFKGALSRL
jgi:hypothetical protein